MLLENGAIGLGAILRCHVNGGQFRLKRLLV